MSNSMQLEIFERRTLLSGEVLTEGVDVPDVQIEGRDEGDSEDDRLPVFSTVFFATAVTGSAYFAVVGLYGAAITVRPWCPKISFMPQEGNTQTICCCSFSLLFTVFSGLALTLFYGPGNDDTSTGEKIVTWLGGGVGLGAGVISVATHFAWSMFIKNRGSYSGIDSVNYEDL